MNNNGQVIIFAFMLMVTIVVLALALAFPVREGADNAMNNMNCTNTTVSDFTKAGCYVADLNPFYFIGALIAIGGIVLTAKIVYGG